MRKLATLGALAGVLWLAPQVSEACPVCFSGRDETRIAFVVTTIFMTGLPLSMIGGLVWWFRRQAIRLQRSQLETQEPSPSESSHSSPA